jgi:peptidoglycan pentaglycine glycine transferase (the first glycine)
MSEEEILKQMHEKGRYNIRLAEKRWVTVESVMPTTHNIDTWMSLLHETTSRDGFAHNSRQYYEVFLEELRLSSSGGLIFAYYEGSVIAAMIMVYQPTYAIYYYWASKSNKDLRKHMAPYLLQWYAMRESKKRGIKLYDFLWIADPNNKNDSLISVSEFKEKFGWYVSVLPQKFSLPLSLKWTIFLLIYSLFRK